MLSKIKRTRAGIGHFEWPSFDFSGLQWSRMPRLQIGDLVTEVPIVQGGMGVGISLHGLASAVANEGGIGVIAANSIGMLDSEYYSKTQEANASILREEIRKTRTLTDGIFGVNIMVAVNDYQNLLRVCIEEKVDLVFLGAGLPIKGIPIENIRQANVKVVPIVSSGRAARLIFSSWQKKYNDVPDAVVVEGPKAGGHLGFKPEQIDDPDYALENIVPDVVSELKKFEASFDKTIPVIAGGGVSTGTDISTLFQLGAKGVQMGTRFVATDECDASLEFKQAYLDCKKEDVVIIKSPVGMPGRAISNPFQRKIAAGGRVELRCAWKCLESCDLKSAPLCMSLALDNARKGIMDEGIVFAGSEAWRVDSIVPVKELLAELKTQYFTAEVKRALSLKEEYEVMLNKLGALKEKYDLVMNRTSDLIGEEYALAMEKVASLKTEYAGMSEKATAMIEELARYLEWGNSHAGEKPAS